MSKATGVRQRAAQEKIATQRAGRRAETRRRLFIAGGSILAVIAVVITLVIVKTARGSGPAAGPGDPAGTALPAGVASRITSVPDGTLARVGTGTTYPGTVKAVSGPPLAAGGKPEILYVGAEFCPYCATERWPLTVALSRFGTFTGLHGIHSSSTDVYPSQPTLTFYKSAYTSKYLVFVPVETTTENPRTPLQQPTAAELAVLQRYDVPPYVPAGDEGAIPFLDIANRYLINGAQYNPQVLQGQAWAQVAAALDDPATPVAKGADGAANMITAAICRATGNQPARVCQAPAIRHLDGKL
jgi:thiol-disulfide isomerase/thioredoxin